MAATMFQTPPQTPMKPMPGRFMTTPALNRQTSASSFGQPSFGAAQAAQQQTVSYPQLPAPSAAPPASVPQSLSLIERAARTINDKLDEEARYPSLDSYLSQGASSDYDIPSSPAWSPFQKMKMYNIPEVIFEQYNRAQVSTLMGLFADINHAWISIDNALYLWDYTHPNPELLGYEEQPNNITAVKLVTPRPGVFVPEITRLLVVATVADIHLIGVACQTTALGAKSVSLYQTKMAVPIRGISVQSIAGSSKTGRIFFAGRGDNEIYELTYQQEDKWFQNRCTKVCHTRTGVDSLLPAIPFMQRPPSEHVTQLVVDDSRNTLYALSNLSTIRAFTLKRPNSLEHSLTRSFGSIQSDISHKVQMTDLIRNTSIVSITPISAQEAARMSILAVTSTGCRIYLSAVPRQMYGNDFESGLGSMQVHHIKFPPPDPAATVQSTAQPSQALAYPNAGINTTSQSLTKARYSERFAPGYLLCFVQKTQQAANDVLFMSAPDSGRIAHPQDPSQANRFPEYGLWLPLDGRAEDVGLVTDPFSAATNPLGFGNELAVQYDKPATEIAVLTNSGIHTFRRRRLVDILAAAIRLGSSDDGLEGAIRSFARSYGRGETIATAIAVACGQASELTADSRMSRLTDPEILEAARKAFIDHGGRPEVDQNALVDPNKPQIDYVRPSPRHEGLALYISRLLRSVWRAPIIVESRRPDGSLSITPALSLSKLQGIQRDLTRLQEFLEANKMFIEGLAGPEALGRVATNQDEVLLQAEHRALSSLLRLISDVVEGIAFVLVLFDEQVAEIIMSLAEASKEQARKMTYERLFCTADGKSLAKELVKAIVNRNIAQGSNVDTVTDALRRRCGSFCSADDCVIFKAQEQLKRASETTSSSELSRNLLNESLRLLQRVAASLSMEQLRWAVSQYVALEFFAGAVQLTLAVAHERDRGNRALAWYNEGSPGQDDRDAAFQSRTACYDLVHQVIAALDQTSAQVPDQIDGQYTTTARRKQEAYDVINESDDELFQINLYDWYLSQGLSERLLEVRSQFAVNYLKRRSDEDIGKADLLWKYYAHYNNYIEAAKVQLQIAKSEVFPLTLEQRIEYLSFARANASTRTVGVTDIGRSRQSRQELMREVSDLLDIADVQGQTMAYIRTDTRISDERRPQVMAQLNGKILPLDELYNGFADQASYWDLMLIIYQLADHRSVSDIKTAWQGLLDQIHEEALAAPAASPQPFESISEKVLALGRRVRLSESTFPVPFLLPALERYGFTQQRDVAPAHWVPTLFLQLGVPHEAVVAALEAMFYNPEAPFTGRNRRHVVADLLYVLNDWFDATRQGGIRTLFGGEEVAAGMLQLVEEVQESDVGREQTVREACVELRARVDRLLR